MAFEIEWLKSAQGDLDSEIGYVYRKFGYKAAEKAFRWIQDDVNKLSSFPFLGEHYDGATYNGFEIRKLVIHQVTVFYSPQTDRVIVLGVWNNYQDPGYIPYYLDCAE